MHEWNVAAETFGMSATKVMMREIVRVSRQMEQEGEDLE